MLTHLHHCLFLFWRIFSLLPIWMQRYSFYSNMIFNPCCSCARVCVGLAILLSSFMCMTFELKYLSVIYMSHSDVDVIQYSHSFLCTIHTHYLYSKSVSKFYVNHHFHQHEMVLVLCILNECWLFCLAIAWCFGFNEIILINWHKGTPLTTARVCVCVSCVHWFERKKFSYKFVQSLFVIHFSDSCSLMLCAKSIS